VLVVSKFVGGKVNRKCVNFLVDLSVVVIWAVVVIWGSAGTTHAQCLLNTVHFGLGQSTRVDSVVVRWRDGSRQELKNPCVDQIISVGK